jgi:hypothetical protein
VREVQGGGGARRGGGLGRAGLDLPPFHRGAGLETQGAARTRGRGGAQQRLLLPG